MSARIKPYVKFDSFGQIKPRGIPRINWSHSLAQGLLFYGFDTGDIIIDLARGLPQQQAPSTTIAPSTEFSQYGSGIGWNNSDSKYFASDSAIRTATAGKHSWACAYVQTGTAGSFARPFGRTAQNGGSEPFVNFDFEINRSGLGQNIVNAAWFDGPAGTFDISSDWTGNANNVFVSLAATFTSTTNVDFYAQGQKIGPTTTALGSSDTSDAIIFSGSSSAASSNPFVGNVFYGAFWNRTLTAEECLQLHLDPYCFLVPSALTPPIPLQIGELMHDIVDRCIFNATSTGTADFVVASAVTGYLTPAQAAAKDGFEYNYAAQTVDGSGNITQWEVGSGTYTVSSTTLSRTTIEFSSSANAKVNFTSIPEVMITALAIDIKQTGSITYVIDGGGSAITTGQKGYLSIPFDCGIMASTLVADTTGQATVDIWKCTYTQFDAGATFPTAGNSITSATPPTITTGNSKATDSTLSSWTTATTAGSVLAFNVNSASNVKRLSLSLKLNKVS